MWIDSFRARVETHPDRTALVTQQGSTTYGELWRRAEPAGRDAGPSSGTRRTIVQADVQAALEAALDAERFFPTGDLMRMDADGYLFNLGRIGRLVKVNGSMTNPAE